MKLIIDIPEEDYKNVSRIVDMGLGTNVDEAIKNGTPLDDTNQKATNEIGSSIGEVMKAVFESDDIQFYVTGSWVHVVFNGMDYSFCPVEFWNAPYQGACKQLNEVSKYKSAFEIACDLLIGSGLYGYDADEIFKIMMEKDDVVSSRSYMKFILDNLDLLSGKEAE